MNKAKKGQGTESVQSNAPLLWSACQVAFHCGLSVRSVWRARSAGFLPPTVKVMSSIRWPADHIRKWTSWNCPNQKDFIARLEAEDANK
ncbi:unnamed protein product [marine sediment metagenome]|uniref:Helix-turn-helix domain-containing protein n=1 Tax=marine sediment metagenome TaxID=412755 RepID=X1SJ50_9ZZZZ